MRAGESLSIKNQELILTRLCGKPQRTDILSKRRKQSPLLLETIFQNESMDAIVLEDIRSLAQLVVEDEKKAKERFLTCKARHHEKQYSVGHQEAHRGQILFSGA